MGFQHLIARLTALSYRRWRLFLVLGAVFTAVGAAGAWRLVNDIRTSYEELLPADVPSVKNAKQLAQRVGGDGTVVVLVDSQVDPRADPQGLKRAEALAVKLADDFRAMPDTVRAVEADIQPVERWYVDHWPMFLPLDRLRSAHDELVKALGEAKARANPLLDLGEEPEEAAPAAEGRLDLSAHRELDELLDPARPGPRQKAEQPFARYTDGFLVHPDGRSVSVLLRPTGTSLGISEVKAVMARLQAAVDRHAAEIQAGHLRVAFGGSYPVAMAESEAVFSGMVLGLALVMLIVLGSVALFYWEIRAVLVIGAILTVGIAVTFGLTWLAIGYLNLQTAFLASIIAGNGLNYGVVYLARVGQLRRKGVGLGEACHHAAQAAARATLLAAVGTSVAFGTLLVATNRGFRHFGFIGGVGMVLCWAATFAFTPAILVLFEKIRPHPGRGHNPWHPVGLRVVEKAFARPRLMVGAFAALTLVASALFLVHLPDQLERDLSNLGNDETGGQQMRRDNDRAQGGVGQSLAGAIALLPDRDAAEQYCAEVDRRVERDRQARREPALAGIIQDCSTIADVVPTHQQERLQLLGDIEQRLTDRVLARLTPGQAARARQIKADLAAQRPLTDAQAPQSLVDRYREKDGTVGTVAFVRAQPGAHLERAPNLAVYAEAVRNVPVSWVSGGESRTGRFDAAGADIVLSDLLQDIERQGPRVTLLSFLCVCALVLLFFRTWARSALLLGSLVAGVALMAGVATLAHIRINFFNFIVYPITFGIAVDYGANVLSRMGMRRNVVPALVEVGGAVILCSWTTIVGYGSLILSFNRALRSFGWYAMLGEFTTLVTALTLLPAMALLVPMRRWGAQPGEVLPGEEAPEEPEGSAGGGRAAAVAATAEEASDGK